MHCPGDFRAVLRSETATRPGVKKFPPGMEQTYVFVLNLSEGVRAHLVPVGNEVFFGKFIQYFASWEEPNSANSLIGEFKPLNWIMREGRVLSAENAGQDRVTLPSSENPRSGRSPTKIDRFQ